MTVKRLLLAALLVLGMCHYAMAGIVRLAWTYEGTGHRGFRVYYGKTSHGAVDRPMNAAPDPAPYEMTEEILDPDARGHELVVPSGTWYFRLVTIGVENDSIFTTQEPVAAVGVDAPGQFQVEWIITKTTPKGGQP